MCYSSDCVFFQAEDGIRDLVRSRGLGDVYKRQTLGNSGAASEDFSLALTAVNAPASWAADFTANGTLSLIHI